MSDAMGDWENLQAQLEAQASLEWLTDTQHKILADLQTLLKYPNIVNLWGPAGSGKTFLGQAWIRARPQAQYAAGWPTPIGRPPRLLIVDHLVADAATLHRLIADLQLYAISSAILISRRPNELHLPTVEMPPPTAGDFDIVYRNLSELDRHRLRPLAPQADLWQAMRSTLP